MRLRAYLNLSYALPKTGVHYLFFPPDEPASGMETANEQEVSEEPHLLTSIRSRLMQTMKGTLAQFQTPLRSVRTYCNSRNKKTRSPLEEYASASSTPSPTDQTSSPALLQEGNEMDGSPPVSCQSLESPKSSGRAKSKLSNEIRPTPESKMTPRQSARAAACEKSLKDGGGLEEDIEMGETAPVSSQLLESPKSSGRAKSKNSSETPPNSEKKSTPRQSARIAASEKSQSDEGPVEDIEMRESVQVASQPLESPKSCGRAKSPRSKPSNETAATVECMSTPRQPQKRAASETPESVSQKKRIRRGRTEILLSEDVPQPVQSRRRAPVAPVAGAAVEDVALASPRSSHSEASDTTTSSNSSVSLLSARRSSRRPKPRLLSVDDEIILKNTRTTHSRRTVPKTCEPVKIETENLQVFDSGTPPPPPPSEPDMELQATPESGSSEVHESDPEVHSDPPESEISEVDNIMMTSQSEPSTSPVSPQNSENETSPDHLTFENFLSEKSTAQNILSSGLTCQSPEIDTQIAGNSSVDDDVACPPSSTTDEGAEELNFGEEHIAKDHPEENAQDDGDRVEMVTPTFPQVTRLRTSQRVRKGTFKSPLKTDSLKEVKSKRLAPTQAKDESDEVSKDATSTHKRNVGPEKISRGSTSPGKQKNRPQTVLNDATGSGEQNVPPEEVSKGAMSFDEQNMGSEDDTVSSAKSLEETSDGESSSVSSGTEGKKRPVRPKKKDKSMRVAAPLLVANRTARAIKPKKVFDPSDDPSPKPRKRSKEDGDYLDPSSKFIFQFGVYRLFREP